MISVYPTHTNGPSRASIAGAVGFHGGVVALGWARGYGTLLIKSIRVCTP
jgi:hypothetical protein